TDASCWMDVERAIRLDPGALARARQVHGSDVLEAGRTPSDAAEADILVSTQPELGVAVQTADCAPVLIADLRGRGAAAGHAGWGGRAANAVSKGVAALAERAGCRPSRMVAAVGPCIGPCCYEVGDEVRQAFRDNGFAPARIDAWFHRSAMPTAV